ncbi:hypothetical protein GCM10007925_18570 [Sphingomonas astaxanthinifaciens DSM 22298]|uniref:DUF885 domain-containing protein n=2 Tax=Sphingomonas TaxID=13687 RepID=A0ABQ5ZBH6_9SPHN|nr:hypothetical protein GCM10007925_18570 [Sphingomonas astaxanthinifaciens DSM 22298]
MALAFSGAPAMAAQSPVPAAAPASRGHAELVTLFREWRAFVSPRMVAGVPDYSAAAMTRQAAALPAWRARLAAIDRSGMSVAEANDARYVESEINALDFFQRVLRPWARDPGFYQNVFAEMSDVPAHEGPSAEPNVDLWQFRYPLTRADDRRLATLLETVPPLLAQARTNLAASTVHDLWAYGDRAFIDQVEALAALEAGTLSLNDLDGRRTASLAGASARLKAAVRNARLASESFAAWVKAEAPRRVGPSGVGKDNYNWYLKNVLLSPYDYDQQVVILQRELDRSLASLRIEEARNRAAPPIPELSDPAAYRRMAEGRNQRLWELLVSTGITPDRPYYRSALFGQLGDYTPPAQRNFFTHVTALDPLPLSSHQFHWIELARLKYEPHASPIRATPPLFNIYADRSEGFATAMEELLAQAGLYDDEPHGRELVWIMLANRAARGLASLRVQANEIDLAQAGQFHAAWTPRGWSDANSKLVGFEQLLYLRQPGYGPSYIIGKTQLDRLLAVQSHAAEVAGRPLTLGAAMTRIFASGIVQPSLIERELAAGAPRP